MTEHAIDKWIQDAIPPGSGRYYAILHTPPESQRRQRAIVTLVSVWSKLCFSNREIEVAQKKLDWWREELDRDNCLHPVTHELLDAINNNTTNGTSNNHSLKTADAALLALLKVILEGYGTLLTSGSPSTEQSNKNFHHATGATACLALCDPALYEQQPEPALKTQISNAGVILSKVRCLRHLHKHVNNGLLCLPMPDLEARDITPDQLVPGDLTDNIRGYLADTITGLQQQAESCLTDFSNVGTGDNNRRLGGVKTVYIYLYLQHRLLSKMQKDVTQIFQPDLRLTPIGNYWQALKAARKFDKIFA